MAQEEHLALAIFGSEQLDKLDGVVAIALQRERRRQRLRIIQRKGLAGAALIPLDDGKEILPWALERPGHRHFDRARSAVNEEEDRIGAIRRSEEHTSELQSLMRISYAVFCLTKKKKTK